nr:MAG TPA: hypothetical protein [Caudoviricetes sp.]
MHIKLYTDLYKNVNIILRYLYITFYKVLCKN